MSNERSSNENPYQPSGLTPYDLEISLRKVKAFTWRNRFLNIGYGTGFGIGVFVSIFTYQISLDEGFCVGLVIFGCAALFIGSILGWTGWVVGHILDKASIKKPSRE